MSSIVAVYNMKGGVGKTTTAVNLSYLAAAGGQRVLLWDLDPQAAASFAFRVRPRVEGFDSAKLENGQALSAAIKATDYENLDLLPADFAYRQFDRLLDRAGKPKRVMATLLESLAREYDVLFLDCPAGFSLLTEGIFRAADAVLVPTVPTVLSLRTLTHLIKWADRSESTTEIAAFFSMVDRHKTLHRQACELGQIRNEVFLAGQVPYASIVEQMSVRRMPLPAYAARAAATIAFTRIWEDLQRRLGQRSSVNQKRQDFWERRLSAVESLLGQLESTNHPRSAATSRTVVIAMSHWVDARGDVTRDESLSKTCVIHRFDTEGRALERLGCMLELHEYSGGLFVVLASTGDDAEVTGPARVQIDRAGALDILSGASSPLALLERRIRKPWPAVLESVRAMVAGQTLCRIDSRLAELASADQQRPDEETPALSSSIRSAV